MSPDPRICGRCLAKAHDHCECQCEVCRMAFEQVIESAAAVEIIAALRNPMDYQGSLTMEVMQGLAWAADYVEKKFLKVSK